MENPSPEQRQIDLEIKFAYLEEHVRQQDREMLKLRDQVDKMAGELQRLRSEQDSAGMPLREGERPPHY